MAYMQARMLQYMRACMHGLERASMVQHMYLWIALLQCLEQVLDERAHLGDR